jgi:hypothetical protein
MYFSYLVIVLLSYSIFVAGIIGAFRFNQIREIYKPFIYLIWIGCLNEAISTYLMFSGYYTIFNGTIYEICESIFLLWFFKKLRVLKTKAFYLLLSAFVVLWLTEVFFKTHLKTSFTYYFNAVYYFCIVLLSIRAINNLLFTEKELLKNSTFLICSGMIIFFTYSIISRMFWLFDQNFSNAFFRNVQDIFFLINFLTNLIYALAVLWMRKRQAFTLQF